jgi:hypothetical protein
VPLVRRSYVYKMENPDCLIIQMTVMQLASLNFRFELQTVYMTWSCAHLDFCLLMSLVLQMPTHLILRLSVVDPG